jgi:transposase
VYLLFFTVCSFLKVDHAAGKLSFKPEEENGGTSPDAHAVLILDQAGWHLSAGLVIPANITLLPLPAKCPELNPVENVWQFMRDNWLSNRMLASPPFGSNPTTTSSTIAASPGTA